MKLKVIDDFLKEFLNESSGSSSTIPVYIFNPSNLMSSHSDLLYDYLSKSVIQPVHLDCSLVSDSKTEFFTVIFKGILEGNACRMKIAYDFMEFLAIFNEIRPTKDIVIIFNSASQLNLSHLDDFVRLWERKSKEFHTIPALKFIFDDSVSFLGMESRLRDKFTMKPFSCPSVKEIFDELIEEMIRNDLPTILHPQLMKRFVGLSAIESLSTIVKQMKFLIISAVTADIPPTPTIPILSSIKDIYLYVSGLSRRLKSVRPSSPKHSPTRDFYPSIFDGVVADSLALNEIVNELKSCPPNDFVLVMGDRDAANYGKVSSVSEFVDSNIVKAFQDKMNSANSTRTVLKDFQLDLIRQFSDYLRGIKVEIPSGAIVLTDERGNVRRAFEADPQFALQVALKYPSVYFNCEDCASRGRSRGNLVPTNTPTSSCNTLMSPIHHNRPTMPDTCILYRLSIEFCSKSINLVSWYKSFLSVIEAKKPSPLHTARFFKALHELQLIGMVSEFGRSRRRRKFVDRFNITDTLEQE